MIHAEQLTIHTDFQQGSDEWREARRGRLGGTSAATLLVNGRGKNGFGDGAITVLYKKVAEFVEGVSMEDFSNHWTDRGNELEPIARREYEDEYFYHVEQVGYISLGEFLGVSPDGLVGDDGGTEFKCLSGPEHIRVIDTESFPRKYYYQCQWGMYLTGRKWWDLCFFHPAYGITKFRQTPHAPTFKTWDQKIPMYINEITRILEMVAQKRND